MTSSKGNYKTSSNFELSKAAPLDNRMVTPKLSDLSSNAFSVYTGMICYVYDDGINNGLYFCEDSDTGDWVQCGGENMGGSGYDVDTLHLKGMISNIDISRSNQDSSIYELSSNTYDLSNSEIYTNLQSQYSDLSGKYDSSLSSFYTTIQTDVSALPTTVTINLLSNVLTNYDESYNELMNRAVSEDIFNNASFLQDSSSNFWEPYDYPAGYKTIYKVGTFPAGTDISTIRQMNYDEIVPKMLWGEEYPFIKPATLRIQNATSNNKIYYIIDYEKNFKNHIQSSISSANAKKLSEKEILKLIRIGIK